MPVNYLVGEQHLFIMFSGDDIVLVLANYFKRLANIKKRDRFMMDVINQIINKHIRCGFGLCFVCLRDQGHTWKLNYVWRIQKQICLKLPNRFKRSLLKMINEPLVDTHKPNECGLWNSCRTSSILVVPLKS